MMLGTHRVSLAIADLRATRIKVTMWRGHCTVLGACVMQVTPLAVPALPSLSLGVAYFPVPTWPCDTLCPIGCPLIWKPWTVGSALLSFSSLVPGVPEKGTEDLESSPATAPKPAKSAQQEQAQSSVFWAPGICHSSPEKQNQPQLCACVE